MVKMKANSTRSDLVHRSTYVISAFASLFRVVRGVVQAAVQRRTRGYEEQGRLRADPLYQVGRRRMALLAPAAGGGRKITSNDGECPHGFKEKLPRPIQTHADQKKWSAGGYDDLPSFGVKS